MCLFRRHGICLPSSLSEVLLVSWINCCGFLGGLLLCSFVSCVAFFFSVPEIRHFCAFWYLAGTQQGDIGKLMNCLLQIFHNFKISDSASSHNAADCTSVRSAERKGSRKANSINQNTLKSYRRCCFIEYFESVITGRSLSCGFPLWRCRIAMSYQFDRKNISHRTLKFNMKGASGVWEECSDTQKNSSHRHFRSPGGCGQFSVLSAFPKAG